MSETPFCPRQTFYLKHVLPSALLIEGEGVQLENKFYSTANVTAFDVQGQQATVTFALQPATLNANMQKLYSGVKHITPPITVIYQPASEGLTVPLDSILAPFEVLDFSMDVYITAPTRHTVENVPVTTVESSLIRHPVNEVASTLRDTTDGARELFGGKALYDQYMRAANSVSGFTIQYAGVYRHGLYRPDRDEKNQLTGLHTGTVPEKNPIFVPAPDLHSVTTDLGKLIDPVYYYGCTTETLYDPEFERLLPENRIYATHLRTYIPLPDGYHLYKHGDFNTVAPTGSLRSQVERMAMGENVTFPVIGLVKFRVPYVDDLFSSGKVPDISLDPVTRFTEDSEISANGILWFWAYSDTYPMENRQSEEPAYAHGLKIWYLDPTGDRATYDAILRWFSMYQYFTHPELRHTLFLGDLNSHIEIGYPEDWYTEWNPQLGRIILPRRGNIIESPYVRVIPVHENLVTDYIRDFYGLSSITEIQNQPAAFEYRERMGYVRLVRIGEQLNLIEFSNSIFNYYSPPDILEVMAEAMRVEN